MPFSRSDPVQDFKDSTQVIAQLDQGGLGLPERDYYFKTDAKSVELRTKYELHVRRMFQLLGRTGRDGQRRCCRRDAY